MDDDSITQWIDGMRSGDDEAVRHIWDSFFHRLVALARQRMKSANRSTYDEEDIVVSAFKSFCAGVRDGKFPRLRDRDDLWRLLLVITARKVADRITFQQREKRDTRMQVYATELQAVGSDVSSEPFLAREPSPEFAAECADQFRCLLDQLRHEDLRQIALLKMEGYTNQEIAARLDRGVATIERKLRTIRDIWSQAGT
ncbi:MAG: ECF-type sigma factor [Pirellulaceae bacterium]